jgi:hypothetical protein
MAASNSKHSALSCTLNLLLHKWIKHPKVSIRESTESEELKAAAAGLNGPQLLFANGVLEGMNQTQAYRAAYPKSSLKNAESSSSTMVELSKVARYLEVARSQACGEAQVSRSWALVQLKKIAETAPNPASRVSSIALLSKMEGWDKPAKFEVNINPLERLVQEIQSQ